MTEKYTLKPGSGKKSIEINSTNRQSMAEYEGGTDDSKYRHEAFVRHGNQEKKIRLVERPNFEFEGKTAVELWKAFKDSGLPVIPTLRETEDGRLFMTDIRADGSELYGKALKFNLFLLLFRFGRSKDVLTSPKTKEILKQIRYIDLFLEVLGEGRIKELQEKLKEYENLANENHLRLPPDDPFELVIHPDRTWYLIILDLEKASIKGPNINVETSNKRSVAGFQKNLFAIKEYYMDLKDLFKLDLES